MPDLVTRRSVLCGTYMAEPVGETVVTQTDSALGRTVRVPSAPRDPRASCSLYISRLETAPPSKDLGRWLFLPSSPTPSSTEITSF